MSTGNFENWAGNIADIGPIYPFVGSEFLWFVLGLVFWIGWHILQTRLERRQLNDEKVRFGKKQILQQIIDGEDPDNP